MGVWDEFCVVCGGPLRAPVASEYADVVDDLRPLVAAFKGTAWLGKNVGVTPAETVVALGAYTDHGAFRVGARGHFHCATNVHYGNVDEGDAYGPVCHRACHKLLQAALGYKLRFADVWPLLGKQRVPGNWFTANRYGGMAKYHGQDLDGERLVSDGNAWMLQDPARSARNAERIVKVWAPLVAKWR